MRGGGGPGEARELEVGALGVVPPPAGGVVVVRLRLGIEEARDVLRHRHAVLIADHLLHRDAPGQHHVRVAQHPRPARPAHIHGREAAQAGDLDGAVEEAMPVARLLELPPGPAHEEDARRILVPQEDPRLDVPAGETA